eukprot:3273538-Rhodomonas_salina.3
MMAHPHTGVVPSQMISPVLYPMSGPGRDASRNIPGSETRGCETRNPDTASEPALNLDYSIAVYNTIVLAARHITGPTSSIASEPRSCGALVFSSARELRWRLLTTQLSQQPIHSGCGPVTLGASVSERADKTMTTRVDSDCAMYRHSWPSSGVRTASTIRELSQALLLSRLLPALRRSLHPLPHKPSSRSTSPPIFLVDPSTGPRTTPSFHCPLVTARRQWPPTPQPPPWRRGPGYPCRPATARHRVKKAAHDTHSDNRDRACSTNAICVRNSLRRQIANWGSRLTSSLT